MCGCRSFATHSPIQICTNFVAAPSLFPSTEQPSGSVPLHIDDASSTVSESPYCSTAPPTTAPGPTPPEKQNQENVWMTVLGPLFWFLRLPGGVLLLVKWLLGY